MTMRTAAAAALGLVLVLAAFPAAPVAQDARGDAIINLGTLGHDASNAVAINNKGQVIGSIADNFTPFIGAFLWEDGVMRELTGGPDFLRVDVYDINDRGDIVGVGTDASTFESVPLRWVDGQVVRLPVPPGYRACSAHAINERGDIVGTCGEPDDSGVLRSRALVWRDGEIIELTAAAGGAETVASVINDRGVVLGALPTADGYRSFVWADGVLTPLDPLLSASDLNDRGQIVGALRSGPTGLGVPVILDRSTLLRLPVPPDVPLCAASRINQRGDAGGWCAAGAAVWVRGELKILPGLSEFFTHVTDLNDRGDAVGSSISLYPDEGPRAVLWPAAAKHPPRRVAR